MKLVHLLICIVLSFSISAQYQINGDATQLDCNCYELTPNDIVMAGSVWNQNLISLENAFDFKFTVFLGCDDAGADGMAFAFQPVGTGIGSVGNSIGLGGISPVLSVVIDTYQNPAPENDPNEDHIGINTNGNMYHDGGPDDLAGPGLLPNVEDCQWHDFRVTWDPVTQTISAYFDGAFILSYTGDVVNDVFGGNPEVYWGLTSATGGAYNTHRFCTELLASFTPSEQKTCIGQDIDFVSDVNSFSPIADFSWDFGDGNTSTDASPTHSYAANGDYEVILTATDQSGCSQTDTVDVFIGNYLSDLLTANSAVCTSESVGLEAQLDESDFPPCEYTLELGATGGFFNYWDFFGTTCYVHVFIDGVLYDSYTMDNGNPSSFTFEVPYGADVQLMFDDGGGNNEDELSVALYDYSNNQLFAQNDLSGMNGTSLFDFTSTCGFVPDYTYSWSPASSLDDPSSLTPTATITEATTYYFDITDNATGCQFTDSVTIDIDMNALTVDALADAATICVGGQVQLDANVIDNSASGDGTFSFLWSPGNEVSNETAQNPTSNPVSEMTYTVTVTENGSTCFALDSVTVTVTGDPVEMDLSLCENSNYTFPDGSTQQITADFDQTSILPSNAGCDSVIISHVTMVTSQVNNQNVTICAGGGITYADGTTSSDLQADESHTSVFMGVNGCDSLIVTNVTVTPPITYTDNVQLCSGSDYTYPDGTLSTNITVNESHVSDLTSFSGCDSLVTTNVSIVSVIQVSVEDTLCPGESYTYPDGSVLSNATVDDVNVSNFVSANGCDSVVTTQISVIDNESCDPSLPMIIAPNVITPNGDGDNDEFFLTTVNIESLEIMITNRWGQVLYNAVIDETTLASGVSYGWNGSTMKGVDCAQGTYFYTYTAEPIKGETIIGHGFIELIRE